MEKVMKYKFMLMIVMLLLQVNTYAGVLVIVSQGFNNQTCWSDSMGLQNYNPTINIENKDFNKDGSSSKTNSYSIDSECKAYRNPTYNHTLLSSSYIGSSFDSNNIKNEISITHKYNGSTSQINYQKHFAVKFHLESSLIYNYNIYSNQGHEAMIEAKLMKEEILKCLYQIKLLNNTTKSPDDANSIFLNIRFNNQSSTPSSMVSCAIGKK
jgi:hypothetical protein